MSDHHLPENIIVRDAYAHNLKHIDVDIPINRIVGIAGVSGSGKSSLALGVLYAEGSRRYLEALSAYTRRRLTQAPAALAGKVLHIPAALALRQRPGIPGLRSTFGTGTELLNSLRLLFSRVASHRCPNGHYLEPSLNVAAEIPLVCPQCGEKFYGPSAEDLSFNGQGACGKCSGTGEARLVDRDALVDESLSIDEGAVLPWRSLMWSLMGQVCGEMGVRTNIPFRNLSAEEKDIVYNGPMEKKHILYTPKNGGQAAELDFTYYNAVNTVLNALAKVKDEHGLKRLEKFLKTAPCPACHGSRLSESARAPRVRGIGLDEVCRLPLVEANAWTKGVPETLPEAMRPMGEAICEAFSRGADRLLKLGLGYLGLDRAAASLSTGERQRMQLAKAVRNRTSGILYVLDEPSIGLHPANLDGVTSVMNDLVADGNSVVLVDHDPQLLGAADWLIELGPGAGRAGGKIIAQGAPREIMSNPNSLIGPFLREGERKLGNKSTAEIFAHGAIHLETAALHTVKPVAVDIPLGSLTVVTGVSGSGKTTLILESLVPALEALLEKRELPAHIRAIKAHGIGRVRLIDAAPIGVNVRSTVATYADVHDSLRRIFGRCPAAREMGLKAGDFSYNTGSLRCPVCDGCGVISLDVQFLPDVDVVCPECHGSRYAKKAELILAEASAGKKYSLPQIMAMEVNAAHAELSSWKGVGERLATLSTLGLGYLTLGEDTPGLSGGEAQRLKLASEIGHSQADTVFVFDEPTIGLHPLDARVLMDVFRSLIAHGATVVVIEHDVDFIRQADYIIDMGPGGGEAGGRVVATGSPEEVARNGESVTGRFLGGIKSQNAPMKVHG